VSGVRVIAPFRELSKTQVVRRGRRLPLHLTFSCLSPRQDRHCGRCNKCAERRRALGEAGMANPRRRVS
jgi:7-cyano-7-deazaguanine synthase